MDANKYRTAYDKAQAVQHEVWTELCQHLEHAPDAQLLSDYTATLVYTLDKDRREEALRLLRGQLYSRQLRDTGRVESWFTDCGARMGQDIEGFVANARQQYVQAGLAEEQRAEAEAKQKAGRGRFRIRPASAFAPERAAYLVQPYLPSLAESGEVSLIYFGGQFSHAIRKRPAAGDFRVQDMYGGTVHPHQPTAAELAVADAVLARTPAPTTYARIDLVEFDGAPALMEAELIEPELFLGATAEAAMNFARVLGGML